MFSSLCSANTKTVLFFTINVFIVNAQSKSVNDSTNIPTDYDTEQVRRSNLLYQVRLPPEDAKKVHKVLRLSDHENKNLVHENKTLQLKVPETFLNLQAFKHALVKRVSEYTVQTSKSTLKFKILSKTTQGFKRGNSKKHVKINGKNPQRSHKTPKKSVKRIKLRTKRHNNTRSGRSKNTSIRAKNPYITSNNDHTENPIKKPIHGDNRVSRISTNPDVTNKRQPKFKSIFSGRSDKKSKKAKRNSINKSNSSNVSPLKQGLTNKEATDLRDSATTGATEITTPTRVEKEETTLIESTATKAGLRNNKPLEESPAVEDTTVTESATAEVSSTVGESTTAKESTPPEESTLPEESTAVEETTPEESTTEESTTTTKVTTTMRLPLARPLVFMGRKDN